MTFRVFDPARDTEAVQRIWREVGWLQEDKKESVALFAEGSRAMVAEVSGDAESFAVSAPGTLRYLERELAFAGLTAVATSRVARKGGLAAGLSARLVAADAAAGAPVVGLCMFEQGFYNQLGFGTGSYEHWVGFDPARLTVEPPARIPSRIAADDWAAVHASRLARLCVHGSCNLAPPAATRVEMEWTKNGFGLGYYDGSGGELSHHIWCETRDAEQGPVTVLWTSFQTPRQFLELLSLLKSLGDQVGLVRMREPPGIQLQDLLSWPFKQWRLTEKGDFAGGIRSMAYWQIRICDLAGCLEQTCLPWAEVRFNLSLRDPIEGYLDEDLPWRGIAGDYVVTLGPRSGAEQGHSAVLPTLRASVGAFSRLWLGVRPASMLAATDDLAGPESLLGDLDDVLRLPVPKLDWDF